MKTKAELVQFLHRCAFSPVVHTWTKAIDARYFATWIGLTSELVRKHLPKLLATAKGHLKQDRQNIRSTKPSSAPSPIFLPSQHEPPGRSHQVFVETVELTGKVSTDQTGRFPVTSRQGSNSPTSLIRTTMATTSTRLLYPATASSCTARNGLLSIRSRVTLQPTPVPLPGHPVFRPVPVPVLREPLGAL